MYKEQTIRNDEIRLFASSPFSYAHNRDYLWRSPNECLYRMTEEGLLYKALRIGGGFVTVEIRELANRGQAGIGLRLLNDAAVGGEDAPPAAIRRQQLLEAARYVREWFDLERDLQPFFAMAGTDPLLQGAAERFRGLRLMGIPDLFEALCWGIFGQQINLAFAYTLKKRFVESFGQSVNAAGMKLWMFPEPESIARLSVRDLTPLQLTARKSEYVIGVAQLMAEGALSKQMLLAEPNAKQIERQLTAIRGIGPWTANYVMMRCLRLPTAFPIDDVGLHNAIKLATGASEKPAKAEIERLSAGWTDWEAYSTFYLWHTLTSGAAM